MRSTLSAPTFASLVQDFFCQHLIQQRNASAQTVASYRDAFRRLLDYLEKVRRKQPATLTLSHLDAPTIIAFLDHLEKKRHNTIRTRNARFAAIRSFLKYAVMRDPASLPLVQGVLGIPLKRFARPALRYLSRDEVTSLLAAPNGATWSGQRDRVLLALLYNTGARVSELIALRRQDVTLDAARSVRLLGKGRKQRVVPLWQSTARQLRDWMSRIAQHPDTPVLPNRKGQPLSRSGVAKRLQEAARVCPALRNKSVSPHLLRHTTAMHLLQSGVDITVIALWLGHEGLETTHHYVEANLAMKEKALAKLEEIPLKRVRYRPSQKLLQFLDSL